MRSILLAIAALILVSCQPKQPESVAADPVQGYDLINIEQLPISFTPEKKPEETPTPKEYPYQTAFQGDKPFDYNMPFLSARSKEAAFAIFDSLYEPARKKEELRKLFYAFTRSTKINRSSSRDREYGKMWVERARKEKDDAVKGLFSQFNERFSPYGGNYRLYNHSGAIIRPGSELELSGYSYSSVDSELPSKMQFELAKLKVNKKFEPKGFSHVLNDTVELTGGNYRLQYSTKIEQPGIYRATIQNEFFFEQFIFQASWLDGLMKIDSTRIAVFGSSYKNTIPAPYDVHFISPNREIYTTKTDSNGVVIVGVPDSAKARDNVQIVIQKGEDAAFLESYFQQWGLESELYSYTYTDRPVYRPGHTVHINGMVKNYSRHRDLTAGNLRSVQVTVRDPQRKPLFSKRLTIDSWGHFRDSLVLDSTAVQGQYLIQLSSPTTNSGNTGRFSYDNQRGSFVVESYKKPEFFLKATPVQEMFSVDEPVKISVHGEYYFGGPLANTPVTVRWYREGVTHRFQKGGYSRGCSFVPRGDREFIWSAKDTLDSKGSLTLNYSPQLDSDQNYLTAEIIAVDKSRREIRTEVRVKVVKSDGYITISPDKHSYEKDETALVEIVAVNLQGELLKAPISFRVKKDAQIVLDTMLSNSSPLTIKYQFDEIGSYRFEATTKTETGKTIFHERHIQVYKSMRWNWDRVELTCDKELYVPGDTARITLKTGADSIAALLTLESDAIELLDIQQVTGNQFTYAIPIKKEYGSRLGVVAGFSGKNRMVYQGVTIPVIDSSLLLNVQLTGKKNLKPGETFSGEIAVSDATGTPVRSNFSVALVDESIFAVADEFYRRKFRGRRTRRTGVLSMFPAPTRYFYNRRLQTKTNNFRSEFIASLGLTASLDVRQASATSSSPRESKAENVSYMNTRSGTVRSVQKSAGGGKGGYGSIFAGGNAEVDDLLGSLMGGGSSVALKTKKAPPRERKNFKDLGYWNGSVTTDEKGRAKLTFPMPDDLTQWRLVLVGSDGQSHLLDFSDSLVTKQDIMVKLQAPRSVVEGDSLLVSSVVHNYSDTTVTAEVELKLTGDDVASLLTPAVQEISLKPGGSENVDWSVKINSAGELKLYSAVTTNRGGDAESRSYPILINGLPRTVSYAGVLSGNVDDTTLSLALPTDGMEGSRKVTITASPTMTGTLFEGLEYLTGYPYGCVEQTMSRFLPNLYVEQAMKRLNIENDTLMAKFPEYTAKGVERLGQLQNSNGGWGWWRNHANDARMTALVLRGLSYALTTDLTDENRSAIENLLKNGRPAGFNLLKQKSLQLEQKIDLAVSLLDYNATEVLRVADEGYKNRGKLSSASLASLLEICHKRGLSNKSSVIKELLISKAHISNSAVYWTGSSTYRWYRQDSEVTAKVVRVLTVVDPQSELLNRSVMWLSRQKRDGYWHSTKTTASVIEALSLYLQNSREFNPDYRGTISLNGKEILSKQITKENFGSETFNVTLSDSDLEMGKLTISRNGSGRLYYSVTMEYIADEQPIKKRDNGFSLKRSYKKIVYTENPDGDWVVQRVPFRGTCKSGDEIEVTITATNGTALEHVMIEDFFPSGMEVLKKPEEWHNRWSRWWWRGYTHKEARDDRMVWFMSDMAKGTTTFTYLLRAETPGEFTALPVKAECMYEPEVNGNSRSMSVTITE